MSLDEEVSKNFLANTMGIWFNPELERRKQVGSVGEDYQPNKIQVILFPHKDNSVLFDDEVIPSEKLKANRNYKDCGHVTFKKDVNGNWDGFFDFEYNKGKAEELFDTAIQFFETAKLTMQEDYECFWIIFLAQQNYSCKACSL